LLLVRALERAGLKYTDVEVVYLPPADGRAAFEKGAIDAWVIWEPYRTAAEMSSGARTLADGTGLVSNYEFFFVTRPFAEAQPHVIEVVLGAARDVYAEVVKDIPGTAKTFSAAAGFPASVIEVALSRRGFGVQPISNQVIAERQKIADTFKDLGLIPNGDQCIRCGSQAWPLTRSASVGRLEPEGGRRLLNRALYVTRTGVTT
jgi:sulfonate transport system substrate-binding protein